jgi:hypothetical protein
VVILGPKLLCWYVRTAQHLMRIVWSEGHAIWKRNVGSVFLTRFFSFLKRKEATFYAVLSPLNFISHEWTTTRQVP